MTLLVTAVIALLGIFFLLTGGINSYLYSFFLVDYFFGVLRQNMHMHLHSHTQKKNKPQPPPQIIAAVHSIKKQPEEMQQVFHIYVSETSLSYLTCDVLSFSSSGEK